MSGIRVMAPAKVNIGLHVLPRSADLYGGGYHAIESIFQAVDLCDVLDVDRVAAPGVCAVSCDGMALPAENTLTKTYRAFSALTGINAGASVRIEKRIPAGGGLGGGSSDAAAFLRALCQLHGVALSADFADSVAASVGSDVFFFLKADAGCALVGGRGELVEPLEPRRDVWFVLVFPAVHSSTAEAYALVDGAYAAGQSVACPAFSEYGALYRAPVREWTFANTFTPVLCAAYPAIGRALSAVRESGAPWADMSGSGAAVFGIFEAADAARHAASVLQKSGYRCVCVQGCGC